MEVVSEAEQTITSTASLRGSFAHNLKVFSNSLEVDLSRLCQCMMLLAGLMRAYLAILGVLDAGDKELDVLRGVDGGRHACEC